MNPSEGFSRDSQGTFAPHLALPEARVNTLRVQKPFISWAFWQDHLPGSSRHNFDRTHWKSFLLLKFPENVCLYGSLREFSHAFPKGKTRTVKVKLSRKKDLQSTEIEDSYMNGLPWKIDKTTINSIKLNRICLYMTELD